MKKTVRIADEGEAGSCGCGCFVRDGITHSGYEKKFLFKPSFADGVSPAMFYVTAGGAFAVKTSAGELFYGNSSAMKRAGAGYDAITCMTDYNEGSTNSKFGALCLGSGNAYMVTATGVSRLSATYSASAVVLRGGRLFYADGKNPYQLHWTGIGGVYDTDCSLQGAGYTYLEDRQKGEIIRLYDYDDSVLCVRRYGFTKMSAMGIAENFAMNSSDIQTAKIVPETVALVDGCIYFCTTDGIYFYDGTDVEALDVPETDEIVPVSACGAGNVYYVYGKVPRLGGNGVACIDVERKTVSYIRMNACVLAGTDKAYAFADDGCYALEAGCEEYDWTSGCMDFGTATAKVLRYVNVPTDKEDVTLVVTSDRGERVLQGAKGHTSVNMRGNYFTVRLIGNCDIAAVTAEIVS